MNIALWTVEIPTVDLARAVRFYKSVLETTIETVDMGSSHMGILPCTEGAVSVVLVHGDGYAPSASGTTAYLEAGDDLQPVLDRVVANGGEVLVPKSEVSPEMGFFAMFVDSEGNRVGLHSAG
jgi:predicted enzyme related to lactoylglutathione lyase